MAYGNSKGMASRLTNKALRAAVKALREIGTKAFFEATGCAASAKTWISVDGEMIPAKAVAAFAAGLKGKDFSGGFSRLAKLFARAGFRMFKKLVALIACSAAKRAIASAAKDLYQGDLFKKARAYAEKFCTEFAILSAKLGLVDADQTVEPYDQRLPRGGDRQWDTATLGQVRAAYDVETTLFVLLCGMDYRRALEEADDVATTSPLAALKGLGLQKQWLKNAVEIA